MEVKKELKYPIKYAVMPIEKQECLDSGLNESNQEYGIVANIVSKCYVIGEKKEYLSDGSFKLKYEVVFLYTQKDPKYHGGFKSVIPKYNSYFQCTNSIFVSQVFNSFEEALMIAEQANKKILDQKIGILPYDENFQKRLNQIKEKHQDILDRYKKIEETIEKETINMKVTKTYGSTLEEIIEKIIESPSDFYIELARMLSIEEREYLKTLIENRSCINCTNGSCRVEYYEKEGLDEFGKPQGSNCLGWDNPELIGRQMVLTKDI